MNIRGKLLVSMVAGTILGAGSVSAGEEQPHPAHETLEMLARKGLAGRAIAVSDFHKGVAPEEFHRRTGAPYKPSFNEMPSIPAQCWIETSYGTQNACLYCHTDYLAKIGHGNAFPLGEDQVLYSFPTRDLNKVLWRNTIFPQEIVERLKRENIPLPEKQDVAYVRRDNWQPAFDRARPKAGTEWMNRESSPFVLFPALNPNHLFPGREKDPTDGGRHGFVDGKGYVRDEKEGFTGWRAVNFFPYGIFTPLSGSVSGIYIRLPGPFMSEKGAFSQAVYEKNLDLLERNIKNRSPRESHYHGDASQVPVVSGFFPLGTEFAHPLHYVDLKADGETGRTLDGVVDNQGVSYEFPGTRSRRVKEIRYMYKWKEVGLDDIGEHAHHEEFVVGNEGQGWVDNNAGWLLAGFIEERRGELRPQTTEELVQCIGCHGKVGNTVDSVWSLVRKLPGAAGWKEMDYGAYTSRAPQQSRLQDYLHLNSGMGELGYFYHMVVGASLYGELPGEVADELKRHATAHRKSLDLQHPIDVIFDDDLLKHMAAEGRRSHLLDRQKVMRAYVASRSYLEKDPGSGQSFVKGSLLYPTETTMQNNISLYRKIVLGQSYNLGKDVFGSDAGFVPFAFRSDGTVKNSAGAIIPVGEVITSRPSDQEGKGITPTGLVQVDQEGRPVDKAGKPVDVQTSPEKAVGHVSTGGTFDTLYNPILSDIPVGDEKK